MDQVIMTLTLPKKQTCGGYQNPNIGIQKVTCTSYVEKLLYEFMLCGRNLMCGQDVRLRG